MPLFTPNERRLAKPLAELAYCNPFSPERMVLEKGALASDYQPEPHLAWSRTSATDFDERPNVVALNQRAERLVRAARDQLASGAKASPADRQLYADLATYALYYRHVASQGAESWADRQAEEPKATAAKVKTIWRAFRDDAQHFFNLPGQAPFPEHSADHLFACSFQVRRAFKHIFDCILGDSLPAAELRGKVWQSIFTHDFRRYRRSLYQQMGDLATLITGPSGSGKELVARAIAYSQYMAFDLKQEAFVGCISEAFLPINLSALSPTLIESELFGHCRGAYTGATSDHTGWLDSCPSHGAVFLDEIGELDPAIQVKLLRVVQHRTFSRLGEVAERSFAGKLIAATNRHLADEMAASRFRHDLYYRLCSDCIETPSLQVQIAGRPEVLTGLLHHLAQRLVGEEADQLAEEVEASIALHLGPDYAWPGNIRELEQCIRNVLVRKEYRPMSTSQASPHPWLADDEAGTLTAEQLLVNYCTMVYARLGSYEQTAQRLGLDRRTVKGKIDPSLLETLRETLRKES